MLIDVQKNEHFIHPASVERISISFSEAKENGGIQDA